MPSSVSFSNISATTASFTLTGGTYGVTVSATFGGGSVTLNRLSLDGSTFVAVLPAFAANGYGDIQLPPGTYQVAVATATAVYVQIAGIF